MVEARMKTMEALKECFLLGARSYVHVEKHVQQEVRARGCGFCERETDNTIEPWVDADSAVTDILALLEAKGPHGR